MIGEVCQLISRKTTRIMLFQDASEPVASSLTWSFEARASPGYRQQRMTEGSP
jgi:hypothetical protein